MLAPQQPMLQPPPLLMLPQLPPAPSQVSPMPVRVAGQAGVQAEAVLLNEIEI